jgi:hypothetical protein
MPTLFEELTFFPLAVDYPMNQHRFPGVPFYNLPQLRQRLLQGPIYCRNATIKADYIGRNSARSEWVRAKNGTEGSAVGLSRPEVFRMAGIDRSKSPGQREKRGLVWQ